LSIREYIFKDIVEKIAIEKYLKNGLGITFEDIGREFSVSKIKAQRKLKYFHERYSFYSKRSYSRRFNRLKKHKSTTILSDLYQGTND